MSNVTPIRKIIGYECKNVLQAPSRDRDSMDEHLIIKLNVHYDDGTVVPAVKNITNFQRDFYITKKQFRNHKQKKTAEAISKLTRHTGFTDRQLPRAVANALGKSLKHRATIRDANESPYVYGTDDTAPVIVKRAMREKFKGESRYTVCAVDIETNVTAPVMSPKHGEILMVGATMPSKGVLTVTRDYLEGMDEEEFLSKVIEGMRTRMPEEVTKRKMHLYVHICDTPGQAVIKAMDYIHEWKPDFLSTWNMAFDAPRMLDAVEKEGYDPADVFSDPSVPREFRQGAWKPGPDSKKSSSGKYTNLEWHEKWHTFKAMASWYWVDAAAVYRWVRTAKGKEQSYALDAVLKRNIKMGKLKFDDELGVNEGGLAWHEVMQSKHKVEYALYNIFDCIGLELLDEKTTDLAFVFPILMGDSEYRNMPSEPKRLVDGVVPLYRSREQILAGTPRQVATELDDLVVGLKDWIVTLPCQNLAIQGYNLFSDHPDHTTKVYRFVADLDVTGAYPTGQDILNISRETTRVEICVIEGVSDEDRRSCGINMTAPRTNAIQIAKGLNKYQGPMNIMESYEQHLREKLAA